MRAICHLPPARAASAPVAAHLDSPSSRPAPGEPPSAPRADVAVVIPVKNRGPLLEESLRAVVAQVPPPAEVLVVDDASTDDSAAVAARHGATVLRHESSQGPGLARNTGMSAAGSRWIAFCDSDDVWLPGHLAGLLGAADGHVLVTAPARSTTGRWRGNATGAPRALTLHSLLVPGEGLVTSGTMVDRAAALRVGGFPDRMLAEDFVLWLRLLEIGSGVETARPSVLYRVHRDQMSISSPLMRAAVREVVAEFADRPWLTAEVRLGQQARPAWDELRTGLRSGDHREVLAGLRWYVGHPRAVGPLMALLAHRSRARSAARRTPIGEVLADAAADPTGRPDDAGGGTRAETTGSA